MKEVLGMRGEEEYLRFDERCRMIYRKLPSEVSKLMDDSFVYNLGGRIRFTVNEKLEPGNLTALELRSSSFPSSIIALAKVVWCEEKPDGRYDVGAELRWVGWKDESAQRMIAKHIKVALERAAEKERFSS